MIAQKEVRQFGDVQRLTFLRPDRRRVGTVVIAPMCQYSADEGRVTDWHIIHLGNLALSGAGLLIIEATAVVPEGRISPDDLGLWSDETEEALGRIIETVRHHSDMPIAIQLAHAGRPPWEGGAQIRPGEDRGWQTIAPSAIPFIKGDAIIREAFVEVARRSARLGLDAIQIHGAHGYLLHQFLSPLSNRRDDEYGGSLENRMRFPLEVYDSVHGAFAAKRPVSVRVSGTDWVEGSWDIEQTIAFAEVLKAHGCSAIHVSSGGMTPAQQIPVGPNYQVPLARAVKAATNLPTIAVGLITTVFRVVLGKRHTLDHPTPQRLALAIGLDLDVRERQGLRPDRGWYFAARLGYSEEDA